MHKKGYVNLQGPLSSLQSTAGGSMVADFMTLIKQDNGFSMN